MPESPQKHTSDVVKSYCRMPSNDLYDACIWCNLSQDEILIGFLKFSHKNNKSKHEPNSYATVFEKVAYALDAWAG